MKFLNVFRFEIINKFPPALKDFFLSFIDNVCRRFACKFETTDNRSTAQLFGCGCRKKQFQTNSCGFDSNSRGVHEIIHVNIPFFMIAKGTPFFLFYFVDSFLVKMFFRSVIIAFINSRFTHFIVWNCRVLYDFSKKILLVRAWQPSHLRGRLRELINLIRIKIPFQ